MKKVVGVAMFGVLFAGAGVGQAEEVTTRLEEVVIVGEPEQARTKTGSAHVVTEEQLKEFYQTDINRILREVPGVYIREEEGYGLRPNIGIRGSGAERSSKISLMEDGVLMAPAPYADPAAYYFPTAGRMSAVEVLKGPETLRYGPFTVGGALNMVSTPIPEQSGGRLLTEVGAYGEKRVIGSYGQSSDNVGWLLETVQHEADGFQEIDRSSRDAGLDIEDYVLKLRLNSDRDARYYQQLDIKGQYSEEMSNMSYLGLTDADFDADADRRYGLSELDEMNNRHVGGSARYRFEFSEQLAVNALIYRNKFKRDWFKLESVNGVTPSAMISEINNNTANAALYQGRLDGSMDVNNVDIKHNNREYDARGAQLTLDSRFNTGDVQHAIEFGARRHKDEVDRYQPRERYNQVGGQLVYQSEILPGASDNRLAHADATSYWLLDRMTWGDVTLLPVIRYEDVRTEEKRWTDPARTTVNSTRKNHIGGATQLGLGATWQFAPEWQLLAGVHDGFAPPGADAVEGTDPEESVNMELGLRFKRNSLTAEAIYFRSDYSNTVRNCSVANPCGLQTSGTQSLGEALVNGLETALGYEFHAEGMVFPVRLMYTYTDAEITKDSDTLTVLDGDNLPDLPEHIWSVSAGVIHSSGWDSYLHVSYMDETCVNTTCDRSGVNDRFLKTDDFIVVDWTAGYALAADTRVYAKVNNLLDEDAIVARKPDGARPNMPRTFYMGVNWEF